MSVTPVKNTMPRIVKMEEFQPEKLSFGDMYKMDKRNMKKVPILYEGKPLVLQTPVFANAVVRKFNKKSEEDKDALIMYMNIHHENEQVRACVCVRDAKLIIPVVVSSCRPLAC